MADDKEATAAAAEKDATGAKLITLESNDKKQFEVSEAAARVSGQLREMIESGSAEGVVPLPNIAAATLERVVQYLNKHAEPAANRRNKALRSAAEKELKKWNAEFVDGLGTDDAFFDLIVAADYLEIDELLDEGCKKIARVMKGKTPEQIRAIFDIPDDFTPQEKEEMRHEYAWAFPMTRGSGSSSAGATSSEDHDVQEEEEEEEE